MKKVFLVGCPRSGTTWLQIILGAHPKIATVRETHLFDRYIQANYEEYQREGAYQGKYGLRGFMDLDALDEASRAYCDTVFAKIQETKPGAEIVLEKTPAHIWRSQLIRRLYPDCRFLSIVRDPRAVIASMLACNDEPWVEGMPADAVNAARVWRSAAIIGHHDMRKFGDHHLEVRYEDLLDRPNETVQAVLSWLELDLMAGDAAQFSIDALRARQHDGPATSPARDDRPNFFRRGTAEGWRDDLSPDQVDVIEAICGDLMAELGYSPRTGEEVRAVG